MQIREISSPTNTAVKEAAKLRRKRNRHQSRRFLAEGEDLLDVALNSGHLPRQVFVLDGHVAGTVESLTLAAGGPEAPEPDLDVYICSEPVMEKLSELGSGSRVIAIFDFIDRELAAATGSEGEDGPLVYLAGVGDPGNAGSIIRSAAALGAAGVAFSTDAVDPYSHKAQRGAMGSIFQMPVYLDVTADDVIAWSSLRGSPIVVSEPHEGMALWDGAIGDDLLLAGDFILALGSERRGMPGQLVEAASLRINIPQSPAAESLNVAMAGTVILYEARRQRQLKG